MKFVMVAVLVTVAASAAHGQVRCKMPNGVWIEQRLSDSCPAGAQQAQGLDGQPLPHRSPVVPGKSESRVEPRVEPAAAPLESSRRALPFEACVNLMTQTVLSVGGRNTRVEMSAPDLRMLRVCTNDGSVLMSCSRLDGYMVTTRSPTLCD